jgi:hypothetical protein
MSNPIKPDPGLFIVKGDIVGIEEFTITENENGELKFGPIVLTSGIDMTPFWLGIAFQHMKATERAHTKLMLAKEAKNDNEIAKYLKQESSSGMQAVVSAGIAIDAYYASVKGCIKIPAEHSKVWREKRTARHKQISEVLRIAFSMKSATFKQVRNILEQSLSWRDRAVHPSPGTSAPSIHNELNKITDWRYATFRFYNVKAIYGITLSLIYKTTKKPPDNKNMALQKYCDGLIPKLVPWVKKWERKYGQLL